MPEYTPTTEEIREYVEVGGEPRPWIELNDEEGAKEAARAAAFDRWLADHDKEVAAQALESAADGWFPHPALGIGKFAAPVVDELHKRANRIRSGEEVK